MASWVLADELIRKFGGDNLVQVRRHLEAYQASLDEY